MTDRVVFSSSDDRIASVSNEPGRQGTITWHALPTSDVQLPAKVTFSAELEGEVAHLDIAPPQPPEAQLRSLQLSPNNVRFLTAGKYAMVATLFYEDPLTGDRLASFSAGNTAFPGAPTVRWQVVDKTTWQPVPGAAFDTSDPNVLNLTNSLQSSKLLVLAHASPAGSRLAQVTNAGAATVGISTLDKQALTADNSTGYTFAVDDWVVLDATSPTIIGTAGAAPIDANLPL